MSLALRQALDLPLTALRASMESLSRLIKKQDGGALILDGAIKEVDRIERNVRELMEFASPPDSRPQDSFE